MNIKKFLIGITAGATIFANAVLPVGAASSLFGSATLVAGGNPGDAIQTVSNTSTVDTADDYGGISFDDRNGTLISSLSTLSSDYNVTDDNCGGGAPRFSITVDYDNNNVESSGDKNVFVYLGDHPGYNTCTPNTWVGSGNLVTAANPIWDTSQVGGTFYDTFANASTLTSAYEILNISLVTDGGWSQGDGEQTVLFDNTNINGTTYNFTPVPSTVTVTIDKYVDGSMATATSANSSAFPMNATWNATNIGAGSGNYDLDTDGFNGNPTPYQAITSEMTTGASYSTNEVTGGSVVGASCTTGQPYALVGYTTGDTLSEAQQGTPSPTVPNFTDLQSDKFVIVWNMTCPVTTPTPNPYAIPAECSGITGLGAPIVGTNGSNVINGTNGNDLIFALGGSDVVNGKGGNDCIVGGDGSDALHGQGGNDVILGGTGSDAIQGDEGNDWLYGQDGSDSVKGGSGNDHLVGGNGSDSLKGDGGADNADGGNNSDACNAETETTCEA